MKTYVQNPEYRNGPENIHPTVLETNHWRSSYYAFTHVRNKNRNIQWRSPYVVKVIYHTHGTALNGKNSLPL